MPLSEDTELPPSEVSLQPTAQLPFEWPIARLSLDFPSVASNFAQNVSRLAVERTLSEQRLTETWLETTCEQFAWEATIQAASVIAHYFRALVQSKHCIDSLGGFILNLWSFGRRPCTSNWLESVMSSLR